jgi:hypothetical protein
MLNRNVRRRPNSRPRWLAEEDMSPVRAPTAAELRKMQDHVDHEMSRLLRLGEALRCRHQMPGDTPDRALRVAYAGHARALLEFFYDGRPGKTGQLTGQGGDVDVWLSDYDGRAPGTRIWDPGDNERLHDADKLLGHLSTGRLTRTRRPNWDDLQDRRGFVASSRQSWRCPKRATYFRRQLVRFERLGPANSSRRS